MINVAIDGPAGAGKSTIAKAAAKKLGFIYVDTGALYRAVGVYSLRNGVDTTDGEAVAETLPSVSVELKFQDGVQHVYLNGEDVSEEIRTPKASMAASHVSAVPAVRQFLFDLQRDIAAKNNCIMDGRDIGTVVLADSPCKIFLTATAEERARRRHLQNLEKGDSTPYETVLAELNARDAQDMSRKTDPLRQAEDAVLVDSTNMTPEQVVEAILSIVEAVYGKR